MSLNQTNKISEIGLKQHLDDSRNVHNNFGYDNFVTMINADVNDSNIARAFGVNRKTIKKWINIYKEQNEQEQ